MAKRKEPIAVFERCNNPQDIPESVCLVCLHTFVAPTLEALQRLEREHVCAMRRVHSSWSFQIPYA